MTKTWPKSLYPRRPVGKIVLNGNPANYFAEIEQAAFSPSAMVRGIEPSADPMLQARMFAYPDAARYRLGVNYQMLPVNRTSSNVYVPTERDGFMNFTDNYGGDPNYVGTQIKPVSFSAGVSQKKWKSTKEPLSEPVVFTSDVTDKDFLQAREMWNKVLAAQEGAQDRFVSNISDHISKVKRGWLRLKVYELFSRVDVELSNRIRDQVEEVLRAGPKED